MKAMPLMEWPVFRAWKSFHDFCRRIGVNLMVFLIPTLLSLLAAFADGVSIGLLIPTVQGMMNKNFSFLTQKPIFEKLMGVFPAAFLKSDGAIFILLLSSIFFFALLKNTLFYFSSVTTNYQVREFANKVRKRIYERFLSFGKMFFDRASFGRLHLILIGHTQQVAQEIATLQNSFF